MFVLDGHEVSPAVFGAEDSSSVASAPPVDRASASGAATAQRSGLGLVTRSGLGLVWGAL